MANRTNAMLRFIWAYLVFTWGGLHRYFGNHNHIRSEYEVAVDYFSRAYNIDKRLRQSRLARAVLLGRELNRPAEALKDFDALLREDETSAPALFNRAMLYQQLGRYPLALADLESYLHQEPEGEFHLPALRMRQLLRDLMKDEE